MVRKEIINENIKRDQKYFGILPRDFRKVKIIDH